MKYKRKTERNPARMEVRRKERLKKEKKTR